MCIPESEAYRVKIPKDKMSIVNDILEKANKRSKTVSVNREYDIPYLAGYSKDGNTIYIDRHMPKFFIYHGKKILTDKYLIRHECREKDLIDMLGLPYFKGNMGAHKISTDEEMRDVIADGIPWRAYNDFMQTYVKKIGDERLTKVPADYDLTPLEDEHDDKELAKVREVMK